LLGQANEDICPEVGSIAERWWPQLGLWAVDSSNGNSWKSTCAAILKRSVADVLGTQETGVASVDKLAAASNEARAMGWNPTLSAAHPAGGNMNSGGGAILARKGTAIRAAGKSAIPEASAHRLALSWVGCILKGGLNFLNVYLKDGEGLSDTNKSLLETAAGALNALKGPWVALGDWNMSPETLASSSWLALVEGVIFATELPTCNDNVYDYFEVHKSIAHAVFGVQRLQDGGLCPHWATRLLIRGDAKRHAVRKLVRPAKVEGLASWPTCCAARFPEGLSRGARGQAWRGHDRVGQTSEAGVV